MKCVYTFRTGRHKRQADITLLFEYIFYINLKHVTIILKLNLNTDDIVVIGIAVSRAFFAKH